ncbi:DUF5776 domain-containing protein [Lentilactobacillus kribbianus]|uniref:DUF5776 domain-containing protein n=1 Tax=Lentilactobacillus kribbianus TaxID=2729622 RepID=UPI00155676D7|nr:DUF5776 domain-containing protein [Lentilactobacillus kribbianus]
MTTRKLISSLMLAGLILGSGATAVSATSMANAPVTTSQSTQRVADKESDFEIVDNMITGAKNKKITSLTIPANMNADGIAVGAFEKNQYPNLTTVDLSKASNGFIVGNSAFAESNVTTVHLPGKGNIADNAFYGCKINYVVNHDSGGKLSMEDNAFASQNLSLDYTGETKQGTEILLADILKNNPQFLKNNGKTNFLQVVDAEVLENNAGYKIGKNAAGQPVLIITDTGIESIKLSVSFTSNQEGHSIGGYSIGSLDLNLNNVTDKDDGEGPGDGTGEQPGGGTGIPGDLNDRDNGQSLGKGESVTFKFPYKIMINKNIWRHKDVQMTQRIQRYIGNGVKRVDRKVLNIVGAAKTKKGTLRYRVEGGGYVTANPKFVVSLYYAGTPKTIKVLNKKGINSYPTSKLNRPDMVKHHKKGSILKIKRIVWRAGKITRYQLTNGKYITANKQLVIWDQYK